MKVCFAIPDMSLGGSSTVVHDLIANWPNKNDDLFLVLFFEKIDDRYKDLLEIEKCKITVLKKHRTIDFPFLSRLKKVMKEISPDIISSHLTCAFYLKLIGQTKRSKIFHTIHAEPSCDMPKIYRSFLKRDIQKDRVSLIGVCEYISRKAELLYNKKCLTINNAVDVVANVPRRDEKKVNFLFVGRFCDVKNIDSIIDSFNFVSAKKNDFVFRICGYGDPETELDIKQRIESNKFSDSIVMEGKTNDVEKFYRQSDVLILVSKREGLPITVLEALSHGLAFVVNAVGGIPEYVTDGYNGFYSRDTSAESIAETIQKILSKKEDLPVFQSNSLLVAKAINVKKMAAEYWNLFANPTDVWR